MAKDMMMMMMMICVCAFVCLRMYVDAANEYVYKRQGEMIYGFNELNVSLRAIFGSVAVFKWNLCVSHSDVHDDTTNTTIEKDKCTWFGAFLVSYTYVLCTIYYTIKCLCANAICVEKAVLNFLSILNVSQQQIVLVDHITTTLAPLVDFNLLYLVHCVNLEIYTYMYSTE